MTPFGFVIHPITPKHAARKYPLLRYLPDRMIEFILERKSPMIASEITGIRSITGAETKGWFIGCPLTPKMMIDGLPIEVVYDRITDCVALAANQGAKVVGLGAFTSVVGDGGMTIAHRSPIPVTTGNSYTVATAIEATLEAARLLEIETKQAVLAVVGATGSIGKTCAKMLAPNFGTTYLVGRDLERTQALSKEVPGSEATTNIDRIQDADVIVTVTSSDVEVIHPRHLKPGSVVCDVARPRDVSVLVSKERADVLVIEGGVVEVPGKPEFNFDFGFPPSMAYACMAETIMLALEDRAESFTLGKDVTVEQVQETAAMAKKHGFRLAGFRSFEKPVPQHVIDHVRAARRHLAPASTT